uniref:Uncharacterized protein n=1 Tax=Aegilops tauschii subsp. strangulata TaxID=200361 RepID=A0A453CXT9_AEGTS
SLGAPHGCEAGARSLHPRPRSRRTLACRAELQQDAPFVAAIGACVLASLVLPPARVRGEAAEEDDDGEFGATDTRMGVMAIISFLPYFNWLVSRSILVALIISFPHGLIMFWVLFSLGLELGLRVARQRQQAVSGLRGRLFGSLP